MSGAGLVASQARRSPAVPESPGTRQAGHRLSRHGLALGRAGAHEEAQADKLASRALAPQREPPRCACGGICPKCTGSARGIVASAAPTMRGGVPNSLLFGGAGRPLGAPLRQRFQDALGTPLDHVRLHDDPRTGAVAKTIGARAFAHGAHIGFGPGLPSPESTGARAVLAHELAHVALGHGGVRRVTDEDLGLMAEAADTNRAAAAAADAHHNRWAGAVDARFRRDLGEQSGGLAAERERIDVERAGLVAQAFTQVSEGHSWLAGEMADLGYSGPSIAEIGAEWSAAMMAAESVRVVGTDEEVDPLLRLSALAALSRFYDRGKVFAEAAECAHRTRADRLNSQAMAQYEADRAAWYEEATQYSDVRIGGTIRGARRLHPRMPPLISVPPVVSTGFAAAASRVGHAGTPSDWKRVADEARSNINGLGRLVSAALEPTNPLLQQIATLESLDTRLAEFVEASPGAVRIPAVFYPLDGGTTQTDEQGNSMVVPELVPWNFYLTIHTQQVSEGGGTTYQWILTDLTNPQKPHNTYPASAAAAEAFARGEMVDPPVALFTPLNDKDRFPEGRLNFRMPSGTDYRHMCTASWNASDWLGALGMVLAGVALVAGVIATGGAATPAAVAFYAGMGAAGLGIASTVAEMHELSRQGLLTDERRNDAYLRIAIDVVGAISLGLGRFITGPAAAARWSSHLILMSRIDIVRRVVGAAAVAGDIWQVQTITREVAAAFSAIGASNMPEEQRDLAYAALAGRALLTGGLLTLSLRGNVHELQTSGRAHVTGVDSEGRLLLGTEAEADVPAGTTHPQGAITPDAPHAAVAPDVHATAEGVGSTMTLAGQPHAMGVAGSGAMRDVYFCSDRCTTLLNRIVPVVEALPPNHPALPAMQDVLRSAYHLRADLQAGRITDAAAEAISRELAARIGRLAADSDSGPTLQHLLDMDPDVVTARGGALREAIARDRDIGAVRAEEEARHAFVGPPSPEEMGATVRDIPRAVRAPGAVMDAATRERLPDFDQQVSITGRIDSITVGQTIEDDFPVMRTTIEGDVVPGTLPRTARPGHEGPVAPNFNSRMRALLGRLPRGWQRLHLWGPGFGDEAAAGMMAGPASINQVWQNGELIPIGTSGERMGIEGFLRTLAAEAEGVGGRVRLRATAKPWPASGPEAFSLPSGEPVLREATYRFWIEGPEGPTSAVEVSLSLPHPSTWSNPNAVRPQIFVNGEPVD